jgi:hypothetical protein
MTSYAAERSVAGARMCASLYRVTNGVGSDRLLMIQTSSTVEPSMAKVDA